MDDTPLAQAVGRVGDRWSLLIVEALLDGELRFNQLAEAVPGIAPNILTKRLRQLEQDGVLVSTPYSTRPLRLAYELTASGRELAGALRLLATWGARVEGLPAPHRHSACGTPLEVRPWCPTCDRVVDEDEADGTVRL